MDNTAADKNLARAMEEIFQSDNVSNLTGRVHQLEIELASLQRAVMHIQSSFGNILELLAEAERDGRI